MKIIRIVLILLGVRSAYAHLQLVCIGHRGACGYEPENTLSSFEKALSLRIPTIEFDVHLSCDGHLVVIHDALLDRTTNGKGLVAQYTLEQLRQFEIQGNQKISTLQEVIEFIDRRAVIYIELKAPGTGKAVAMVVNTYLNRGWRASDFAVLSFNHEELAIFKAHTQNIPIGALFMELPISWQSSIQTLSTRLIGLPAVNVSCECLHLLHAQGFKVYVFTLNDSESIQRYIQMGVDGICSDFPDRVIDALHI